MTKLKKNLVHKQYFVLYPTICLLCISN